MGPGEVRYLSDDGKQAVVRFDGESKPEVWLPVIRLFRIDPGNVSRDKTYDR